MIIICECCNSPIERLTDVKLVHKECKPEASIKQKVEAIQVETYPNGTMNVKNAALYLGCRPQTLNNWRVTGEGPQFIKARGRVFYEKEGLDKWLEDFGSSRTTAQARLSVNSVDIKNHSYADTFKNAWKSSKH